MSKINKVLYNVDQTADTSEAERRLARKNIGLDEVIGHATTEDDTGIAPLGENGLVPAEYLPSFVNAVVNGYYYNGKFYREAGHTTEISPDENTTYVDITVADVGVGYRWTQASGYFQISSQNAFGALKAGNDTIHADQPMDLLTVVGDSGITVSVADTRSQEQNGSDKLTIGHSNSIVAGQIGEESPTTTQINNTFNLPWASFDAQGHITAAGSNAITIKNATTGQYGVTKLTSTPGTDETLAMTPKGVQTAIAALNATVGSTGGTNVALTVTEAGGVITGVSITKDDTAKASHPHGNITSDGKVTTAAASKKAMLITNSSDQVVTGPAFGTASGDDNLFLNKNGNWISVPQVDTKNTVGIGNDSSMDPSGGVTTPKGAVFPFVDSDATGSNARSYTTHGSNSRALLAVEETSDASGYLLKFDGAVVPTMSRVSPDSLLVYDDISGMIMPSASCGDTDKPIFINNNGVPQVCTGLPARYHDYVGSTGVAGWLIGITRIKRESGNYASASLTANVYIQSRSAVSNPRNQSSQFAGYVYINNRGNETSAPTVSTVFNSLHNDTQYWHLYYNTVIDDDYYVTKWYIAAPAFNTSSQHTQQWLEIVIDVVNTVGQFEIPSGYTTSDKTSIRVTSEPPSSWTDAITVSRAPFVTGSSSVGGSHSPVYVDANGEVKECTLVPRSSGRIHRVYRSGTDPNYTPNLEFDITQESINWSLLHPNMFIPLVIDLNGYSRSYTYRGRGWRPQPTGQGPLFAIKPAVLSDDSHVADTSSIVNLGALVIVNFHATIDRKNQASPFWMTLGLRYSWGSSSSMTIGKHEIRLPGITTSAPEGPYSESIDATFIGIAGHWQWAGDVDYDIDEGAKLEIYIDQDEFYRGEQHIEDDPLVYPAGFELYDYKINAVALNNGSRF
jgi:hypothetical protein